MKISDERREIAERMRGPFDMRECIGTIFGMQVCARVVSSDDASRD